MSESKKLRTMIDEGELCSIAFSGDPEEGLLSEATEEELVHDARIAHEQRSAINEAFGILDLAMMGARISHSEIREAMSALRPFLED